MALNDFRHQIEIKVQWGEMDAMKHVNNASYVRWGESARMAYFVDTALFDSSKHVPILGFQSLKYIAPVIYPDTIRIGTSVDEIKTDRFIMKSHFFSEALKRLVLIQYHEIVVLGAVASNRVDIPQEMIDKIRHFEGS